MTHKYRVGLCAQGLRSLDMYGRTPLMITASEGHSEVASALLAAGAEVNQISGSHETTLMYAARDEERDPKSRCSVG